jgi:hypothetical protein
MHYGNVAPSHLPTFLLPCSHCGHRMEITAVAPALYANGTASNDLEDITHTCVQCGTMLTSTRPFPNRSTPRFRTNYACEVTSMARPQRKLKLVKAPRFARPRDFPRVPDTSLDTIDFLCGNCGTLLMHVREGQVHGVFIHCTECGACNTSAL